MYKKYFDSYGNLVTQAIVKTVDNICIPFDPDNTDYQQYLYWLADGNMPLPADEAQ